MVAACAAAVESAQLLLGAGASVNARNELGETALMHMLRGDSADADDLGVVAALLAAGADVTARDHAGDTPLHHLMRGPFGLPDVAATVARLLLRCGADGRAKNDAGETSAAAMPEECRDSELYRVLLAAAAGA